MEPPERDRDVYPSARGRPSTGAVITIAIVVVLFIVMVALHLAGAQPNHRGRSRMRRHNEGPRARRSDRPSWRAACGPSGGQKRLALTSRRLDSSTAMPSRSYRQRAWTNWLARTDRPHTETLKVSGYDGYRLTSGESTPTAQADRVRVLADASLAGRNDAMGAVDRSDGGGDFNWPTGLLAGRGRCWWLVPCS